MIITLVLLYLTNKTKVLVKQERKNGRTMFLLNNNERTKELKKGRTEELCYFQNFFPKNKKINQEMILKF